MKEYIDRYIYDVVRRLPEHMKEDVSKELKQNIEDMLEEDNNQENLEHILKTLGNPRKLAHTYKAKPAYVVSPLYYDDYLRILKIVIFIFASVGLIVGMIEAFFDVEPISIFTFIIRLFSRVFNHLFNGVIQAFAWTTLVFWGISYLSDKEAIKSEWKLEDLPEIPQSNHYKINRVGTLFELSISSIFNLAWIIVLMRYIHVIGIYDERGLIAPIINAKVAQTFIPFFIITLGVTLSLGLMKLFSGKWSISIAIAHTAATILFLSVILLFIHQPNLILYDAYFAFSRLSGLSIITLQENVKNALLAFTYVLVVLSMIDLLMVWYRALKKDGNRLGNKKI
jgi:hypothetical protein